MQYVIKKSEVKDIITEDVTKYTNKAVEYLQKIIDDAKKLENKKIAVYGQGLILEYLIGSKILNIKNVTCIIDDNPLYHNKLWKNTLPIFDFHTFEKKFHTKKIFLAMSDCYHIKVTDKLSNYDNPIMAVIELEMPGGFKIRIANHADVTMAIRLIQGIINHD